MLSANEVSDIVGKGCGCLVFAVLAAIVMATVAGYEIGTHIEHDPKHSVQSQ